MFKQMLTKKKIICVLVGILLVLIVWIAWGNTALELNTYTISSRELPDAFDGTASRRFQICTMQSLVTEINGFWICCGKQNRI